MADADAPSDGDLLPFSRREYDLEKSGSREDRMERYDSDAERSLDPTRYRPPPAPVAGEDSAATGLHPWHKTPETEQELQSAKMALRSKLLPKGFRSWDEVVRANQKQRRRRSVAHVEEKRQERVLKQPLRPPKGLLRQSVLDSDGAEQMDLIGVPRAVTERIQRGRKRLARVEKATLRILSDRVVFHAMADVDLRPGGNPVRIVDVEFTPDLHRAFVRWELSVPARQKAESVVAQTSLRGKQSKRDRERFAKEERRTEYALGEETSPSVQARLERAIHKEERLWKRRKDPDPRPTKKRLLDAADDARVTVNPVVQEWHRLVERALLRHGGSLRRELTQTLGLKVRGC